MKKRYLLNISIVLILFVLLNTFPSNIKKIIRAPKDLFLSISNIITKPILNIKDANKDKIIEVDNIETEVIRMENSELKKEIIALKEQLNLNELLVDKKIYNATVINRSLESWNESLTIDKGSIDGIKNNMAVLYKGYLVGQTYDVNYYSSKVKLLSNDHVNKLSIKIDIGNKDIYGILTSYQDGQYKIEGITDMDEIPLNAVVSTTGLSNNVPSGLQIGNISNIETDNYDLAKIITVTPAINFNEISYVMVVDKK